MKMLSCINERIRPVKSKGLLCKLFGDPKIAIEQELQLLKFPGGLIEIARCDNGDHWAHVFAYSGDRCEDTLVESHRRHLAEVRVNGAVHVQPYPGAAVHAAIRIVPGVPQHDLAADIAKDGWGMSFPGGFAVLREQGRELAFHVRVLSSVNDTRLDHDYPHPITDLPLGIEQLDVRLSAPA